MPKTFILIRFILNNELVETNLPPSLLVLDYIRYVAHLKGTKIGCREGDCGACTALCGEIKDEKLMYKTVTSCLMPLGNAHNRHIVTIEGINGEDLTPVQQCFSDEGATQCGFCTPGFIVSLTGYCLNDRTPVYSEALAAIDGNICRCTGYKSIERAVGKLCNSLTMGTISLSESVKQGIIPSYFLDIQKRLSSLQQVDAPMPSRELKIVGGGTDLYVQQHEAMINTDINFIAARRSKDAIRLHEGVCEIQSTATVADIAASPLMQKIFPNLAIFMKLVSSTQIRNMATIAGNFCNASPIGDLTIFFLSLETTLTINDGTRRREVQLKKFYRGYKDIDLAENEFVELITFPIPAPGGRFNFEKVSKRMHLDIASVNAAILLQMDRDTVLRASLSAGGVGPIPLYLAYSSQFLIGKVISSKLVNELLKVVQQEISPISDARGSAEYKRLLLSQLIKAHFIRLFPAMRLESLITVQA